MAFIPSVEPWLDPRCSDATRLQIDSGFLGPGKATQKFAERLASLAGISAAIPTTSGTVALSVAAIALGLQAGHEVIVPAYGVISTINAFASIGLQPRLAEIDRATGCLDPVRLRERLTPRTKAICFVNFSGNTGRPLQEIAGLCKEWGLPLIEDAACAMGQKFDGRSAGAFGTVGCFSFSVPKIVTTGQGGAILTDEKAVADKAQNWIDHGDPKWRTTNLHHGIGTNLRFNDVLASLGLAQLDSLDKRLARKRRAYAAMRQEIGEFLFRIEGDEAPLHNIVFCDEPHALVDALRKQEIAALIQYRYLANNPVYAYLDEPGFEASRLWERTAVYLPFGLALTEIDALRVGKAVKETGIPLRTLS